MSDLVKHPAGPLDVEIGDRLNIKDRVLQAVDILGGDGIFHDYQKEAVTLSHEHDLLVIEKGRRTGLTWAFAGDDVVTASTQAGDGGDDVFYIGPSFDMAREYIDACAGFAKAFMDFDAEVGEFMFQDEVPGRPGETRYIQAYRIAFASGHKIVALTSAPSAIRGRQGLVRIDEGAFHNDLEALLAAALPLIILGSRVVVISTHDGADNDFNKLVQAIRSGEQAGHVMTIPFMLAVAQGLYERIATIKKWALTEAAKTAGAPPAPRTRGRRAPQDLDVVPSKSAGKWLAYDLIERAEEPGVPVIRLHIVDEEGQPGFAFKPDDVRDRFIREWCERELGPYLELLDSSPIGVGGDYARYSDLSVIWLLQELEDRSWRTPFVVEMRNVPFTEQLFVWTYILRRLKVWRAKADAHGSGGTLVERLQQIFGLAQIDAIKALAPWWMAQGTPLHSRFEDDRILIPQNRDIATDLRMVEVVNGAPRVPDARTEEKADDGADSEGKRHGDAAVALFHASAALREGAIAAPEIVSTGATGAPTGFLATDVTLDAYATLDFSGFLNGH